MLVKDNYILYLRDIFKLLNGEWKMLFHAFDLLWHIIMAFVFVCQVGSSRKILGKCFGIFFKGNIDKYIENVSL